MILSIGSEMAMWKQLKFASKKRLTKAYYI